MLFCKLTSPVTVNVCQVRNLYISETTIPITPNAPKLLLTTRFLTGNHTPKTNKMTDTIPIGLSRFIKPVISCTPFNPPYWLNNIGNKLIRNAIDRIIFFFIHSHSFAKFRFFVLCDFPINGKLVTSCNSFSYLIPQTKPIKIFQFQAIRQPLSLIHCLYTLYPEESHTCNKNN